MFNKIFIAYIILTLGISFAYSTNTDEPLPLITYSDPLELVSLALENNLDIQVSRLESEIIGENVSREKGRFSPIASIQVGIDRVYRRQNADETRNNFFGSARELYEGDTRYATVGLGGRTPLGTSYEFTANSTRNSNTFTAQENTPFDPEYSTNLRLKVTQPLWKNFGLEVGLAPLNISKAERAVAQYETEAAIESIVAQVLLSCYEVYFGAENIKVKKESIVLANQLLSDNQKRVDQGRMSKIAVTQAEARIAEAEAELIAAEAFYKERQSRLQELTQMNYSLDSEYILLSNMDTNLPKPKNIEDRVGFVRTMLTKNGDFLAAVSQAEAEGYRVKLAKNATRPDINLILSIGSSGLENDFGSSYQDIENRVDPDWGAGLSVSYPLNNATAKSEWRATRKRERQAELQVRQTENQLLRAVDTSFKEVESGLKRKELIGESVRLAKEALKAEEARLANGVTTNIEVLNQQRELSLSQTQALAAEVEIRKAWLQLLLLQGTLTEYLGFKTEFKMEFELKR